MGKKGRSATLFQHENLRELFNTTKQECLEQWWTDTNNNDDFQSQFEGEFEEEEYMTQEVQNIVNVLG